MAYVACQKDNNQSHIVKTTYIQSTAQYREHQKADKKLFFFFF